MSNVLSTYKPNPSTAKSLLPVSVIIQQSVNVNLNAVNTLPSTHTFDAALYPV